MLKMRTIFPSNGLEMSLDFQAQGVILDWSFVIPLPWWERNEVRGITLIPTFSHQGRRGHYQAIPGCAFLYSSAGGASGFLNIL